MPNLACGKTGCDGIISLEKLPIIMRLSIFATCLLLFTMFRAFDAYGWDDEGYRKVECSIRVPSVPEKEYRVAYYVE